MNLVSDKTDIFSLILHEIANLPSRDQDLYVIKVELLSIVLKYELNSQKLIAVLPSLQ